MALVGCGRWGQHAGRDLLGLGCELTVVARSAESIERATAIGASRIVDSIESMGEVEGIVVCTTTTTHFAVIDELLERSRAPIFVEKPLCLDAAEARSIRDRGGERVFVMDKWRYHPGVEALGALVRSQTLGSAVGLRTSRLGPETSHDDVDSVWVLTPHEIAIGLEIFGEFLEPRTAVAQTGSEGFTGMVAILGDAPWHAFEVSGRREQRRREIALMLEGGIAWLPDPYADHIAVLREGASEPEQVPIATDMPLELELRAFVEFVGGGPTPRSSAADACRVVELIKSLREMASSHQPVSR